MPRFNSNDLYRQAALGVHDYLTIDSVPASSTIRAGSRLVGNTALPNGTYTCLLPLGGLVSKVTALLKATFTGGTVTTSGGTLMLDGATAITAAGAVGAMTTATRQTATITPLQGELYGYITIVVAGGALPVFTEGEYFGS